MKQQLPLFWNAIINPKAFKGKSLYHWAKVKGFLWENGFTFNECDSPSTDKCEKIIQQLIKDGQKHFLVVGGDGTLNQVINAVIKTDCALDDILLAVVPAGTGNDWARTHKIKDTPEAILDLLKNGIIFKHDLGKISVINDNITKAQYFLNIAGLGFDAEVILRIINKKQPRYASKLVYLKNLLLSLLHYKPVNCALIHDGIYTKIKLFTLAAGICKYNGNGMMQTPMAIADDGFLDVVYIEPLSIVEIITQLPKLFNGTHIGHKKVHHLRTKKISIMPEKTIYAETEGEIVGSGTFVIESYHKQINVIVPSAHKY